MALTQNLLSKTLRWYLLFAVITLLITAPIFYLITSRLYVEEANETLRLHKKEFIYYHLPGLQLEDIERWNQQNRNEKIIERKSKQAKSIFFTEFQYDTLSHENEPYRVMYSPITIKGKPYTYVAKINLVEREDMIKSIGLLFFGLISTMLIGLYFITRIISKRLWKPFHVALAHIEEFEVDKSGSINLSNTDINEFIRLNQAIEELITKNTSIYKSQKEFIENAAHELQTPLAVIQAKLEALFQQSNLTQSQSEVLEQLNESVTRLSRLNKNLLLLSRIDYDQFTQAENIALNELLEKHFEFFVEQAAAKKIRMTISLSETVGVNANPILTEVLLSNLLLNAIRHNVNGGEIDIILTKTNLSITNTGGPALPDEKIFERFSKINPSTHGTGLGLAIVKKIAGQNQWKITYEHKNNLHTFSIYF